MTLSNHCFKHNLINLFEKITKRKKQINLIEEHSTYTFQYWRWRTVCNFYIHTYVVCSKSVANFEFPRVTYIRFSIFCAVMLILTSLTYADNFGHFECSVNFWRLFCLDVFWLVFDFAHSKKWIKEFYQIFRVERSIRNMTCKLCAICSTQFARNARTFGRTKIDFCTMITPLLTHRYLCANFWPKTTQ